MILKTFIVPPTLFEAAPTAVDDPFDTNRKYKIPKRIPQESLENAGITFPEGASAKYIPSSNLLIIRNVEDEMELVDAYLDVRHYHPASDIKIINEFIEVDRNLYQDWLFKNRITIDGTDFRKIVQKWIKAGEGTVLDTTVVSSRQGNRAKAESIRELIYPTEFEPAKLPEKVNLDGPDSTGPETANNGAAFEVRNLGVTLEVDPVVQADGKTIDLNLAPQMVKLAGYTRWPPPENGNLKPTHKLPQFYTIKTTTHVRVENGRYAFIATHRPLKPSDPNLKNTIVLHFVRADIETIPIEDEHE